MHTVEEPGKSDGTRRRHGAARPATDANLATGFLSPACLLVLQRSAGNTSVARMIEQHNFHLPDRGRGHPQPVQRYTVSPVGALGLSRISTNSQYVIAGAIGDDATTIWVQQGAPVPRYCQQTGNTAILVGGHTYSEYRPSTLFLADCLHTAEEVMHQQTLALGQDASNTAAPTAGVAGQPFGVSNRDNVNAARGYAAHRPGGAAAHGSEQPGPGQAFAIVETSWTATPPRSNSRPKGPSGFPYHAAAVVAVDGGDQITLEQSAGVTDAQPGNGTEGIFDMYTAGQGPGGQAIPRSFHGRHAVNFTVNAITITIEPRNLGNLVVDPAPRNLP